MRKLMGLLLIALMVGCSQVTTAPPDIVNVNGVQVIDGPGTAGVLTTLYNRRFPNCHNTDSQPSFLCSGITLRVTVKDPAEKYKVWDPSPNSIISGGVSFSYLRADANFGRLAWGHGNGFILYPIFEFAPPDKIDLDYLCSFPMDGWTWNRTTPCGASADYPNYSRPCHVAGVTTAAQWLGVWTLPGGNAYLRQCGFDVQDDRNYLAGPAFYESIRAKGLLGTSGFNEHNEIIIKTWTPGRPNTFPIMAFFFVAGGDNAGLADARYNQRDFYNSTNPRIVVPIIRLTPANSAAGSATFTYVVSDQAVTQ
ncbi:hypothetical protein [Pseudomonas thivervalensis]|uniref:hypothetical protein n=1 Tax=Pseudomonas thivervalensis TaxID=86265 RepID=UPI00069E47F4|nr:hypothetical protein [Pseudomonas thivervalensis]OAB53191.1 halovibrin HvnC [Pseudomonas thivervalensis]SDF59798.1 hypothetical protein SAMN04490204_1207 [Pseudomonas thivervalensis]